MLARKWHENTALVFCESHCQEVAEGLVRTIAVLEDLRWLSGPLEFSCPFQDKLFRIPQKHSGLESGERRKRQWERERESKREREREKKKKQRRRERDSEKRKRKERTWEREREGETQKKRERERERDREMREKRDSQMNLSYTDLWLSAPQQPDLCRNPCSRGLAQIECRMQVANFPAVPVPFTLIFSDPPCGPSGQLAYGDSLKCN